MKKLYYFLFMLPLLALMAACSDDDKDLPKVDISIQYSGAVEQSDGAIAVAQGQTFTVDAITVSPAPGTKKAMLGNTTYSIDGVPFYTTGISPFSCEIGTSDLAVGDHSRSRHLGQPDVTTQQSIPHTPPPVPPDPRGCLYICADGVFFGGVDIMS